MAASVAGPVLVDWKVPLGAVVGVGLGLFVVGFKWRPVPSPDASDELSPATGDGQPTREGSTGNQPPDNLPESVRLWAASSAVAVGFGAGVACALYRPWKDFVPFSDLTGRVSSVAFMAGILIFVCLVFLVPPWYRAGRAGRPAAQATQTHQSSVRRLSRPVQKFHQAIRGPEVPIRWFVARQIVIGAVLLVPAAMCFSGMYGAARRSAAGATCAGTAACARQVSSQLDARRAFSSFFILTVLLMLIATLLIALAQRALREIVDPAAREYYQKGDVVLFGGLLSLLIAVVALPSFSVVQAAGHELAKAALDQLTEAGTVVPLTVDWFAARDRLMAELSPDLTLTLLIPGLLGIVTPLVTGIVDRSFQARRESREEGRQETTQEGAKEGGDEDRTAHPAQTSPDAP